MNSVPALVRFVRQRDTHSDCGVACLGSLAGVTYEEALAALVQFQPAVLHSGATWIDMRRAAKRLGLKTRIRRTYDLHEATGILRLTNAAREDHFVFLWAGRIVQSGDEGWEDPEDFLKHYGYRAKALMVMVED
jgi:ABC-type bacteriocin/lantibiotic exporter with double-glycine peptidase domain